MKAKIEKTALELAELLTKLAAHVLRSGDVKPIKILDADGATVASLAIEQTSGSRSQP
jgi:hypothetical protein